MKEVAAHKQRIPLSPLKVAGRAETVPDEEGFSCLARDGCGMRVTDSPVDYYGFRANLQQPPLPRDLYVTF